MSGKKYDNGKLQMSLIDPIFIEELAEVLTFGANKYGPNNWQEVEEAPRRYKDALLRHIVAYLKGEVLDQESGLDHLAHAACNVMFLMYLERNK